MDTSVYSQRLRPKPLQTVIRRWRQLGDMRLAISIICEAELLFGLEQRQSDRLWHHQPGDSFGALGRLNQVPESITCAVLADWGGLACDLQVAN